jgi:hypothetical protein
MYYDIHSSFQGDVFMNFQYLINFVHENINLYWITNLNTKTNHLAFEFVGQHIWATFLNQMGASNFVTKRDFVEMVASMKKQCEEVASHFIIKLQGQFLAYNLIDGFGNVYPQYWLQSELETKFATHLVVLKYAFY